jgi:hypothetical protein
MDTIDKLAAMEEIKTLSLPGQVFSLTPPDSFSF